MGNGKTVTILLVEDDEIDIKALRWAFDKLKTANPLSMARDGVDALAMLPNVPRPNSIITDINTPRKNGIEFLRKARETREYRDSILFVLTTSNDDQDKIDAYDLNVAGYTVKSDMGASFTRAVGLMENYWKIVEFLGPDRPPASAR
jgi:CheY-like chemotaxis protein